MIRQCIVTSTDLTAVQDRSGQWKLEGPGHKLYKGTLPILQSFFPASNSTFHATMSTEDCLQRIANNESDFANVLTMTETMSPYLHHPAPLFIGKTSFLTGYAARDEQLIAIDTATVFSNADLLSPGVYLWALVILLCLILFIVIRIFVVTLMRPELWSKLREKNITRLFVIRSEMSKAFYYSSDHFKWITLLYSLLCFYMINGFLCLYKTSQVIVVKPFYPQSYQESLDHKTSLAFYYDKFSMVSDQFIDAPAGSLKRKLWNKLVNSGRQDDFAPTDDPGQINLLQNAGLENTVNRSILIGTSFTLPLVQPFMCAFSPEDQLYFTTILSDPIEPEFMYGYALSRGYKYKDQYDRRQRHVLEAHFMWHHYITSADPSELLSALMDGNREHIRRQRIACTDEDSFAPQVDVKAIPLFYFETFFLTCITVWIFAFIIHYIQIFLHQRKRKTRKCGRSVDLFSCHRRAP